MPKVNFEKVEKAFDKAAEVVFIENLSELATIITAIEHPETEQSKKYIEIVSTRFQKLLKKLKKADLKLFQRLGMKEEDEKRLMSPPQQFTQEDWRYLKEVKDRIDSLKKELYGEEILNTEFEAQVTKERKRHINKRFNVKDGWLPLQ